MSLDKILKTDISRKPRRRVGRGIGSGLGKTGGRGQKGESARTGGKNRGPLFEGGQVRFYMRLPKRGFTNAAHRVVYQAVDVRRALEAVQGDEITVAKLVAVGLVKEGIPVKLTGGKAPGGSGELKRKVNVQVHRVTASVRAAVEAKGGTVTELDKQQDQ